MKFMQKKSKKRRTTQTGTSNVVTFPNSVNEPTHTTEAAFDAQKLIYDAWETPNRQKRLRMAHKALELWPDCADAYVFLAEDAGKLDESLALYEKAVTAGERALGKQAFEEDAGHFWLIHETRPYMRALWSCANAGVG